MADRNRFGLSRYIPAAITKQVRRRCKFGCVVCGSAIVTYEHIDPVFSDARRHDPTKITLLCGHHQLESSKGLLSKKSIQEFDANPKGSERGYVDSMFDLGGKVPSLVMGGNELNLNPNQVFSINDLPILKIEYPERKSRKWRLSGIFYGQNNRIICHIESNELRLLADNSDIIQKSNRFCIINENEQRIFELEISPPDELRINFMTLVLNGHEISIDGDTITFTNAAKTGRQTFKNCMFSGINFTINENGLRLSGHSECQWPSDL
jgi:hypothetical protein